MCSNKKPDNGTDYNFLMDNMIHAYSCMKILKDDSGNPIDCVFIEVNRAFEKLTGKNKCDIIDKKFNEIFSSVQNLNINWKEIACSLETKSEAVLAEQYLEIYKRWFNIRFYSSEEGYLLLIMHDITDIVKARERLLEAQQVAHIGNWEWDIINDKRYWSDELFRILGFIPQQFEITKGLYDNFIYPDDRECVRKYFRDALITGIYNHQYRIVRADGTTGWVHDRGSVELDASGKPVRMFGTTQDITERKLEEDKIRYLSFHDKLTDLYNRAYFEEEIKRLDTIRQLPLSIIMGDVNGLKITNDILGHHQGDRLLQKIARILSDSCRKEDIIARWGGDEFAIILPETRENFADVVCQRIGNACQAADRDPIQPSIALGHATKTNSSQPIQQVLKEAENRMYQNKLTNNRSVRNTLIFSLQEALSEKNIETHDHLYRLCRISRQLGLAIGLNSEELDDLEHLAILHDIGKSVISDEILKKPGRLTAKEWEIIIKHPEIGHRIAESSHELSHIADYIMSHHERWNGKGYPRGLKGTDIPYLCRILSIAEAYDIMTGGCSYKKTVTHEDAVKELINCAGTQFDPQITEVFVKIISDKQTQ